MIPLCIFFAALGLDQLTKWLVRESMVLGQSIPVLGDVLRLTYVENPGIAFGIRVGNSLIFTILSILACVGVFYYWMANRKEGMKLRGSLALILGGAVGNLIDRVLHQQVVDFIDVGIGHVRWPVFNVADSVVVIGMAILFLFVYARKPAGEKAGEIQ